VFYRYLDHFGGLMCGLTAGPVCVCVRERERECVCVYIGVL